MTSESLQASFRYLFLSELAALKQLARSLPPNPVVVNIGAGSGTSGLAFMESRSDLFMITVDIEGGDSPFGSLYSERHVLEQAGIPDYRYHQILGDSKQVGETAQSTFNMLVYEDDKLINIMKRFLLDGIPTKFADLVFIDGDHSYNGAKGDILAWIPNIKPGGIMAVHDFNKKEVYKDGPIDNAPHPLPWPGVDRAVRKFLCPFYEIVLQVDTLIVFKVTEEGQRNMWLHRLDTAIFKHARDKGLGQ